MNQLFVRNKFFILHLMVIILGFTGIIGNESFIELGGLDKEIQSSALADCIDATFIINSLDDLGARGSRIERSSRS